MSDTGILLALLVGANILVAIYIISVFTVIGFIAYWIIKGINDL